jgi:ABC-type polysaccharide transport system permease subunit
MVAFHLPSGEHGGFLLQGTFPGLITWKVFTAFPMFASVVAFTEYLIRGLEMIDRGRTSGLVSRMIGTI